MKVQRMMMVLTVVNLVGAGRGAELLRPNRHKPWPTRCHPRRESIHPKPHQAEPEAPYLESVSRRNSVLIRSRSPTSPGSAVSRNRRNLS